MHARHRSPGNGYRSGSMGMGLGGSRISPDGSARGRGFYNSDYRSFGNRGFGRGQGQSKSFQQPPQPPGGRTDVLMEAGRLAAEYLVSKGLLPRNVLYGKWQNGSFKKQVGNFPEFRQQEDLTQEDRTSAQLRMDAGSGRRRFPDDLNLKNNLKGRRRGDYYRNYSSDWGREYGRSGSGSDTSKVSREMEEGDDSVSVKNEEQPVAKGDSDGTPKSSSSVLAPENKEITNSELQPEKNNSPDDIISKANSLTDENGETGQEPSVVSGDRENLIAENEERKDSGDDCANEEQIVKDDLPVQECATEDNLSGKNNSDLVTLCRFINVPTKTRSALSSLISNSKSDSVSAKEEENDSNVGVIPVKEVDQHNSSAGVLVSTSQDSKCPNSKTSVISENSTEHGQESASVFGDVQAKCARSQSFPGTAFLHYDKEHSSEGLQSVERSISVEDRGEKRALEDSALSKDAKKPREWHPSLFDKANEHLNSSNLREPRTSLLGERASTEQQVVDNANQDRVVNDVQYSDISVEIGTKYAQEKQLFPSSFKICDLNLMESSDLHDNHSSNQVLAYPSSGTIETGAAQIDIDLSISNPTMSRENPRRTSSYKNIEVIDLENDCIPEDKTFDNLDRKMDAPNAGTDGFSSHAQNATDITDVQDNYDGLMMPEFFSNCSTVTEDINPLRNDMGLHNGEGTLGDDDSIYMSLGEIPFSFIPTWDQPMPQEYEKPF